MGYPSNRAVVSSTIAVLIGLAGGIRIQYQHVTEVFPTLDELRGVKVPTSRQHGVWALGFRRGRVSDHKGRVQPTRLAAWL